MHPKVVVDTEEVGDADPGYLLPLPLKYRVDVFVIQACDREDTIGQLRSPVPGVSAPILNRSHQPRQLMDVLNSTPDATYGVQQPDLKIDVAGLERAKRLEELSVRRSQSKTHIGRDGFMITREEVRPSPQKIVVGGRTMSKSDLFSVVGQVRWIAGISRITDWGVTLEKIRRGNGSERNVGQSSKQMVEHPGEIRKGWESAPSPWESVLPYYQRILHMKRRWPGPIRWRHADSRSLLPAHIEKRSGNWSMGRRIAHVPARWHSSDERRPAREPAQPAP